MSLETTPRSDDDMPHDPARSRAQIEGLLALLGAPPKRVLELGCGAGRVLVPLAERGHAVAGIDLDPQALATCRKALHDRSLDGELHQADFREAWPTEKPFDAVLCVGNTFMTVSDVDDAVALLSRARGSINEDGRVVLDDFPHDLWPELTGGNWQSGVSEDGQMQLVWTPGDATFALRRGDAVDETADSPRPDEPVFRLWSMGELTLAARLAGLSAPRRLTEAGLLIMQPV